MLIALSSWNSLLKVKGKIRVSINYLQLFYTAEMRRSRYRNVGWVMIVQKRVSNFPLTENEAGQ